MLAGEGIEATQATISRDLREIGAVKTASGYTMPSALVGHPIGQPAGPAGTFTPGSPQAAPQGFGEHGHAGGAGFLPSQVPGLGLLASLRTFVVSVERGCSMIVIKTGPRYASLVAAEIDREMPVGVLGTVAGDDTILIACRGEAAAKRVCADFTKAAGVGPAAWMGKGAR